MIPRLIETEIIKALDKYKKIVLIMGARQVGKTTLLKNIQEKFGQLGIKTLYLNCDIDEDKAVIDTTSYTLLQNLVSGVDILMIDEAQRLDNPGLTLKILYDNFKDVRVIATGSSSFDLKNKLSEPLTGRYVDFTLCPLSFIEVLTSQNIDSTFPVGQKSAAALLPKILLYGFYPEIYLTQSPEQKKLLLTKIRESYLFRDILAFQKVKSSQLILDLTRALAYQIGSEINESELANRLKIDRKTVLSYLDILEKAYVIKRQYPFSKNPRREIGKNYKLYFTDIGVRNELIGNFQELSVRPDVGALWENFLVNERMKLHSNIGQSYEIYFWRNYGGAEVDYLEKTAKGISAYEFKYGNGRLSRGAQTFLKDYNIPVKLINQDNYLDFIT